MANPHSAAGRLLYGAALADATLVVVAVHGRDQSPAYLVDNLIEPVQRSAASGVIAGHTIAWLLPAANGNSWYPQRFMDALIDSEPLVGYSLETMADIERELTERSPAARVVWAGFSQGACVVTEHVARPRIRPPAGLICLTGALIGPPDQPLRVAGSVTGMPAYFSNSEVDEWVPLARTKAAAEAFRGAGADVQLEVIPRRAHVISAIEITSVAAFLSHVVG